MVLGVRNFGFTSSSPENPVHNHSLQHKPLAGPPRSVLVLPFSHSLSGPFLTANSSGQHLCLVLYLFRV